MKLASNKLPLIGISLSLFFWVIDSLIDLLLFNESESLIESLFFAEPIELWMRSLVVVLLVSFSFLSRALLEQKEELVKDLDRHQNELEDLIAERTDELLIAKTKAEKLANTDSLTGVDNRRSLFEKAVKEMQRVRRYDHAFSIIIFDGDHFKKINDSYGHAAGDQALINLVEITKQEIRNIDIFSRIGGEEFAILLPEINTDSAYVLADRLRLKFQEFTG